jgi:hypothetical protein
MMVIDNSQLAAQINRMAVGQCLRVSAQEVVDAFPPGLFESGGGLQGAVDRLLSKCIGSAYGTVRARIDPIRDAVTISRHEPDAGADLGTFVYHVDPDRQDMFNRVPGGWERRPDPARR